MSCLLGNRGAGMLIGQLDYLQPRFYAGLQFVRLAPPQLRIGGCFESD